MQSGPPRRQLHGYVSREAFEAWQSFARTFGITVTALFEALAEPLAAATKSSEADLPAELQRVVLNARGVASERSTRRRVDQQRTGDD